MHRIRPLGLALLLGLAPLLGGCAALSSLNSAASTLDTYELTAPAPAPRGATGGRVMLVGQPTASAALATDRIMIRPGGLQVAYLADGRWVDQAPVQVQRLLIRALAGTGRVAFVGSEAAGPLPDFVLLSDLEAFQAEVASGGAAPYRVNIRMTLTLLRDVDRGVVASRTFQRTAPAASADAATVVAAFDAAMRGLLAEAADWATAVAAGAGA